MNNRRDGFVFSGKGNPQNVLGQQVVLKYRITVLCISTLLKYIISIKRHHLHFYINKLLVDLFVKHTALGKMSVNRTNVESGKRLIWRLYSGIQVYSVFRFYYLMCVHQLMGTERSSGFRPQSLEGNRGGSCTTCPIGACEQKASFKTF